MLATPLLIFLPIRKNVHFWWSWEACPPFFGNHWEESPSGSMSAILWQFLESRSTLLWPSATSSFTWSTCLCQVLSLSVLTITWEVTQPQLKRLAELRRNSGWELQNGMAITAFREDRFFLDHLIFPGFSWSKSPWSYDLFLVYVSLAFALWPYVTWRKPSC